MRLTTAYLGFVVLRPIPAAPLGKTVVRWYPEHTPNNPRVTSPSRDYSCHLAGVTLRVHGLAWQQQDQAVSACATVGIWSMLHSSALDDHHHIPTTAEITITANRRVALGARTFPSGGLTLEQLLEAIKDHRLAPLIISGGKHSVAARVQGFERERFASSVASLIRSGYPVLLIGMLGNAGLHAVCATGFRSAPAPSGPAGRVVLQDCDTTHIYIHDDNIGPNVRFKLTTTQDGLLGLETEPPASAGSSSPTVPYHDFTPIHLIAAVHDDLRMSPDFLHSEGIARADGVLRTVNALRLHHNMREIGATLSTRFMRSRDYIGQELGRLLQATPKLLGRVRLALREQVPPMSPHLGIVRVALGNSSPLLDILYDTTDIGTNQPVFASVVYSKDLLRLLPLIPNQDFGRLINADL